MNSIIFKLPFLLLGFSIAAHAVATPGTIDPGYLKEKLYEFTGEKDVNINGKLQRISERGSAVGKAKARAYLRAEYEAIGYSVFEQVSGSGQSKSINLVAERSAMASKEGDPDLIMLGAHYDSVGNRGADDDASGVISGLAVAHALKDLSLTKTLRVVAFDLEEKGLVGSKRYVESIKTNGDLARTIAIFVLEMLGYDGNQDGNFHVIDCGKNNSARLSTLVLESIALQGLALTRSPACTRRSDHAPFWDEGKDAVVISQDFFGGDSNPCYHRDCDTVDKIDFDYMANLTAAVAGAVLKLAQ